MGSCEFTRFGRADSDPYLYKGVHVSLIGHDVERIKALGEEVSEQYRTAGHGIQEGSR